MSDRLAAAVVSPPDVLSHCDVAPPAEDASEERVLTATTATPAEKTLNDRALKRALQELRQTDNFTNWYYLAIPYTATVLAAAAAVASHQYVLAAELSVLWCLPVFLLAIVVAGATQHQFINAAHEASHYTLFKSRWLNENAADWLCMFPLFMTTYSYRLQHLVHHQYVNSERDPDRAQLIASGHWLNFPASMREVFGLLYRQLWLPNLVRHITARMNHRPTTTDGTGYVKAEPRVQNIPPLIGAVYTFGMFAFMLWASIYEKAWLLAVVPSLVLAGVLIALALLPESAWPTMRVKPTRSLRATAIHRMLYIALLWNGLAWLQYASGMPVWGYFVLLWGVPVVTTFSLFLLLEQIVQHGNGDSGWLTNSRVFKVNPLIRFAVFPFGTNYHLPHHMYATVPHYNLPKLHELLLQYPEYAEEALVAEGYFGPVRADQTALTALQVLGPDGAPRTIHQAFVDNTVLDVVEIEEREKVVAAPEN